MLTTILIFLVKKIWSNNKQYNLQTNFRTLKVWFYDNFLEMGTISATFHVMMYSLRTICQENNLSKSSVLAVWWSVFCSEFSNIWEQSWQGKKSNSKAIEKRYVLQANTTSIKYINISCSCIMGTNIYLEITQVWCKFLQNEQKIHKTWIFWKWRFTRNNMQEFPLQWWLFTWWYFMETYTPLEVSIRLVCTTYNSAIDHIGDMYYIICHSHAWL